MIFAHLRHAGRLSLCALGLALASPRADAQFGYGYGFGYNFNQAAQQQIGTIDSKALLNASQATMGPVQNNVYANNPNSYINHLHDDGYLDKYDVGTRRTIEASIGRYSDGPPPRRTASNPPLASNRPPQPAAPVAPAILLSSFFDKYQKLVWPDEAPTVGILGGQRSISDQASLAVLNEYNLRGLAQLSTVTEARSKLLDYGRPALEYMRANSTPRIADTFHLFLLSLYESLAQAATIPNPKPPASSPTASAPAPAATPAAVPR